MRMILCLLALGGSLLAPLPAKADWQNTRWGMTRSEVVAATGAAPSDEQRRGNSLGASGDYQALGYQFRSTFHFDEADRLRQVRLTLTSSSECDDLLRTMHGLYGSPDRENRNTADWVSREGNDVRLLDNRERNDSCTLLYVPTVAFGAAGL